MYIISYVFEDAYRTIECSNKETANQEYLELLNDPAVSELEASVRTVDVKFPTSDKTYTYFINEPLDGFRYIKAGKDKLKIVRCKIRTVKELRALAKSQGFSFSDYKVLKGTAIKKEESKEE